jgi:hypothetical protein
MIPVMVRDVVLDVLCYIPHYILRVFMLRIFPYIVCDIPHYILRVFMLRIFPYIVCDIPHFILDDTRICYRRYL